MSTLLIIDVQENYRKHCNDLITKLPEIFKEYDFIYYLWDNIAGETLFEQVPEEWLIESKDDADDSVYTEFNKVMSKQYGFFRDFMDSGNLDYSEEDIIKFGKFMIRKGISDSRDILEDESIYNEAIDSFKNSFSLSAFVANKANFKTYVMTIPFDLIEVLQNSNNYIIVGGGINECVEEVRLLLEMIGLNYTVRYEFTY